MFAQTPTTNHINRRNKLRRTKKAEYTFEVGLKKPLDLAVVSDLHSEGGGEVLEILKSISPDAVLCPGDVIHKADPSEEGIEFLRQSARLFPTFLSMGNHEVKHGVDVRESLRATGAVLLDNEFCSFGEIKIGGLSTGYTVDTPQSRIKMPPRPNIEALSEFFSAEGFKLLLCHHPEYFAPYLKDLGADLILSGHAHGGQWRILGQGIFAPGQGLFPKYTSGLYENRLLVSTGLSNKTKIPRIFNPRTLIIIKLK